MTCVETKVLPVGYQMEIYDPNCGEKVRVCVVKSGWREKGGCICHPQWYEMFEAKVEAGFEPGRIVRGYIDEVAVYTQGEEEEVEHQAFLLCDPNLDEITRDLRLARKGKLSDYPSVNEKMLARLEHVLKLREELQSRGWSKDYLRKYLKIIDGTQDLRFFKSCGDKSHRATGWLNSTGVEVVHDGYLVETPGATSWDSEGIGQGPKKCGCLSYDLEGYTVVYFRGYPQVYITEGAKVERVEGFLRRAFEDSPSTFRRSTIPPWVGMEQVFNSK